ncbi:MAG: periplasmic heavy metal sensor [Acidobacteriota bacterium]|nr:periplasmic heavy metal sensor [Acidobacteriota bacterium]
MRRWLPTLFSLLVVWTLAPVIASEQSPRPHRWWQSDEVKTLLELTNEQAESLDKIYRQTLPKRRESWRRLNAEERTLSQLIADMQVEEIDITRQIDRVEAARSELSKTRTLMVFRMYRVLNPGQRVTLKEWRRRDDDESGARGRRC